MQGTYVSNLARDECRNITFNVLAHRKLSNVELQTVILTFERMRKTKLKKNASYTIIWNGARQ